jgi:hypothetical protein
MVPQSQTYCVGSQNMATCNFFKKNVRKKSKIEKKYNTPYLGISVPPYSHFFNSHHLEITITTSEEIFIRFHMFFFHI